MQRILVLSLIACLSLALATPALAREQGPMEKLGRGVVNIVGSIFEVPATMMQTGEDEGFMNAMTKGLVVGVFNTAKRLVVGAYETVTFPVPVPEGYEPIMEGPAIFSR